MLSDGSVTSSAAALYVESSNGNAGGLIGSVTSGTVKWSYSGGHTTDGGKYSDDKYDVTAKNTAGGLIGVFSGSSIDSCYSTCSVKGATAGGLVGTSSGSISISYSTGKVSGTTASAFAASSSDVFLHHGRAEVCFKPVPRIRYVVSPVPLLRPVPA